MRKPNVLLSLFAAIVSLAPVFATGTTTPPTKEQAVSALFGLAVPFEENKGQADSKVAFQARTVAGPLFVTKTGELVWSLTSDAKAPVCIVVERFIGGQPQPVGAALAQTRVNYLIGNDPAKWQRNVSTWNQVSLGQVWPGVTVNIAARGKNAEKIFTLAPGADVAVVTVAVEGGALQLEQAGSLRVTRAEQPVVSFSTPIAWQEINGQRQSVQVAYRLDGEAKYGFTLGAYDAKHPVMIDPVVQSTFLGGTDAETVNAVAANSFGVFVAGKTASATFPNTTAVTTGGYQPSLVVSGTVDEDGFIARLSADLKTVTQATYLGGAEADEIKAMVVNSTSGDVYVAGSTTSDSFPGITTAGDISVQSTRGGVADAFVTKLSAELTLPSPTDLQSTYLGGSGADVANAIAVTAGNVFVAGVTSATYTGTGITGDPFVTTTTDLPGVANGIQATRATPTAAADVTDAFVAKLPLSLTGAGTQATYFGGAANDTANAIAVNATAIYIAGSTSATGLPSTTDSVQPALATSDVGGDAYVARLGVDLLSTSAITPKATYLGGAGADSANAVAINTTSVYVAGSTTSNDSFPFVTNGMDATADGMDATADAAGEAFVTRLKLDLTTSTADTTKQSTYLGGTGADSANALYLGTDAVYVAGTTIATDFPLTNNVAAQPANGGGNKTDAFVARLGLTLKATEVVTSRQATYLGGSDDDTGNAIAFLGTDVYVAGTTKSLATSGSTIGFPLTLGGADVTADDANGDGFVTKLSKDLKAVIQSVETLAAVGGTIKGKITPKGAAISAASFNLGPTTTYGTSQAASPDTVAAMADPTEVSATITASDDIVCGTTYHYQAVAVSSLGITKGLDKTFTLPCSPTVSVSTPDVGIQSAILKGIVNAKGNQTLAVSFVFGDNSVSPVTATTTANGGYDNYYAANPATASGDADIDVIYNKTGLTCGKQYFYRVKIVSANPVAHTYSNEISFTTDNCTAPAVITEAASNITKSSVTLKGKVASGGASATVSFQVSETGAYTEAVAATTNPVAPAIPVSYLTVMALPSPVNALQDTSVTGSKTGLECYKRYNYRVKATNTKGTSYGSSLPFDTLGCAPIVTLKPADYISPLQANLNAIIDSNGAEATVKFDLGVVSGTYSMSNIDGGKAPAMLKIKGTSTDKLYDAIATKTGLTCNKLYYYRVRASNSVGSVTSTESNFRTQPCIPVATTLPATDIVSNGAILRGSVIPQGLGSLVTFDFGKTTTYGYSVSPTGLTASGTPSVNIAAGNTAGNVLQFNTVPVINVSSTISGTVTGGTNLTIDCGAIYNYRTKIVSHGGTGAGFALTSPFSATINGSNQVFTTKACTPVVTTDVAPVVTANNTNNTSSATLKGTVDANGSLETQVSFDLGLAPLDGNGTVDTTTAPAYETPVPALTPTVTGTAVVNVTATKAGLKCSTNYSVRTKVVGKVDGIVKTVYGDRANFLTSACDHQVTTDYAKVEMPVGTPVTTSKAMLYGTVITNGRSGLTVTFNLGTTTAYELGTKSGTLVESITGADGVVKSIYETDEITGLTCGNKTHNFRIKAVAGTVTKTGLNKTFTTLGCDKVPEVKTTDATTIKTTGAVFNGLVKSNGNSTTVVFDWGLSTSAAYSTPVVTANTVSGTTAIDTVVTATKTGLTCGQTYRYRVRATNIKGTTFGADKTFTTVCPPSVSTLAATNITASSATFNASVHPKKSNTVVTFDFSGTGSVANNTLTSPVSLVAAPGLISGNNYVPVLLHKASLTCGEDYFYRVKAVNNANNAGIGTENTSTGTVKSFTTVCDAPLVTTEVPTGQADASATNKVTATLNGTVDTAGNGAATASFDFGTTTNYGTKIAVTTPANGAISAANANPTAIVANVPNLTCGVTYHYRTRATNAGNPSGVVGLDQPFYAVCPFGVRTDNTTSIGQTASTLNGRLTSTNTTDTAAAVTFDLDIVTQATSGSYTYRVTPSSVTPSTNSLATTDFVTVPGTASVAVNANLGAASNPAIITPALALTCSTTYYYRLKAVNSGSNVHGGGTRSGAERTFRTAPCTQTAVTAPATAITNDVTANSATLNGVVNAENQIGGVKVQFEIGAVGETTYNISTAVDATDPISKYVVGSTPINVSAVRTGLTCNTEYRYRVKSIHAVNGITYGADVKFKPLCVVTNAAATSPAITTTTATIKGTVTDPTVTATVKPTVIFEYGTTKGYGSNAIATPAVTTTSATEVTAALTGLSCGTTYHYRIKAITAAGGITYGEDRTFDTVDTACTLPNVTTDAATSVTGIGTSGGTANGATLNGKVDINGATASTVTAVFEYGPDAAYGTEEEITTITASTGVVTEAVTELDCDTTYHYRVKATVGENSYYGSDATFNIICTPTVTDTVTITPLAANTATLKGTVNANGANTTASFEYGPATSYGYVVAAVPAAVSGTTSTAISAAITGLVCGTKYYYRVRAVNAYTVVESVPGTGASGTFTTVACQAPVTEAATPVGADSATLNGTVTANGATIGATGITFLYGKTTSYGSTVNGTPSTASGSTVNITGPINRLTCGGVTYNYRIKVVSNVGTLYGNNETFVTDPCQTATTGDVTLNTTGTTATLNGTVNAKDVSANGTVTPSATADTVTASFEYDTDVSDNNYATAVTATTPTDGKVTGATATEVTKDITGLTCGTIYHYRVKTVSAVGVIVYGVDKTFTTPSCQTATTVAADNIVAKGAQLKGSVDANNAAEGVVVSFDYGTTADYGINVAATTPASGVVTGTDTVSVSKTLSGLVCGKTYHYRVKTLHIASNTEVNGTTGSNKTFMTKGCQTVTTTAATSVTDDSVVLNGVVNANGTDAGVAVKFDWSIASGYTAPVVNNGVVVTDAVYANTNVAATPSSVSGSTNASVRTALTTGIAPSTTYHYRVKAVHTDSSTTVLGPDMTFTTPAAP